MIHLPWLYYKDSKGTMRAWTVGYENDFYQTYYGPVHGIITESDRTYCSDTNVGRVNHRNKEAQAKFEAEALWQNKIDRRYRKSAAEAEAELFLPMLAGKYDGRKVSFPVYVQPKLDGVRCLAYWSGEFVALMSRAGKPYDVPHISKALETWLPSNVVLDGELYCHGLSCQSTTSLVRGDHDQSPLRYFVYDLADGALPFQDRYYKLLKLFKYDHWPTCLLETGNADSHADVVTVERSYVGDGYEGAIVRLIGGMYKFGRRSNDLLKVKTFQDDEFEVIDWKDGDGKLSDCCIFQCKNDVNDATFWCIPKGTIEEREAYASNAQSYIGKKLTVKYFDRTDDGIPRFPVGLGFKDDR